jgi:hypothetical protein
MLPSSADAYEDVLAWARETSSDDCIGIDRRVSGVVVGACLPRISGPAMDVAELEDGRHFVRSLAALMLNSGVIPIDGEEKGGGSYEMIYADVKIGHNSGSHLSHDNGPRYQDGEVDDERNDVAVPRAGTGEDAQLAASGGYTAEDFVSFLRAVQRIEAAERKAIGSVGASGSGGLFEVGMAHLGRFVGAPLLAELSGCFEKPSASAAVYRFAILRQFSNEWERKRGRARKGTYYNEKCDLMRVDIDKMFDPEADAYTHVLNISRYRCKLAEVASNPDAAAGWLDDMIVSERRAKHLQHEHEEGKGADMHGSGNATLGSGSAHHYGGMLEGAHNLSTSSPANDEAKEAGEGENKVGDSITGADRLAFVKKKLCSELVAFVGGGATSSTDPDGPPSSPSAAGGAVSPLEAFRDRVEAGVGGALDHVRSLAVGFRRQSRRAAREERWAALSEALVHSFVSCKAVQFALM